MIDASIGIDGSLSLAMPERMGRGQTGQGGEMEEARPVVLFLCTHNAGRSRAGKVLLEHYAAGRVEVRSGGSAPGEKLNASVVAVLEERGLDVSSERPKALSERDAREADVVVTMGCGDACPYYPGRRYLDWDLPDPAGLSIEEVRPIVDEIDRRVQALLAELVAPSR
jgi:arsenate reductase